MYQKMLGVKFSSSKSKAYIGFWSHRFRQVVQAVKNLFKGGESSSRFGWFIIAKIEQYFLF